MQVELCCPDCVYQFTVGLDPSMQNGDATPLCDHQLYPLGDGQTLEDLLFGTLTAHGPIQCPSCGAEVPVTEENLSELALDLLAAW